MPFYKDLTYYVDKHYENALNVGWEENPEPFEYSRSFQERIGAYLKSVVLQIRGGSGVQKISFKGNDYQIGYGEFRVIGPDDTVYACPDTLIAKVFAGEYKLPECFEKAVNEGMDPDSLEYRNYLENFRKETFWGASEAYLQKMSKITDLIKNGDIDALSGRLLFNPDLLDIVCEQGSLLSTAILSGQKDTALYLIDQGFHFELFHGRELLYAIETGMEEVALKLLDCDIPYTAERIGDNPLFTAIRKPMNSVAKRLFLEKKELIRPYNDIYVGSCNLLQWTKRVHNDEMMQFIMNQYQKF